MAAYVEETARSYPNPISSQEMAGSFKRPSSSKYRSHESAPGHGTGTDYQITFQGAGPGSYPLGKDSVHYIGDNDPQCVGNCDGERQAIYRFWRSNKRDHKYAITPQLQEKDMGVENEDWKKAAGGYRPEPKNGKPVFYLLREQLENTVPVKLFYSYWPDNTLLHAGSGNPPGVTVGNGRGKHADLGIIGYAYTSQQSGTVPLYHYRYGNYGASKGKDIDDFYTIDPSQEVNLGGGPIPPRKARDGDWQYQGIECYVYSGEDPSAPKRQYRDIGKIGPTGQCINKRGWYAFEADDQPFNWRVYNRGGYPGGYGNGPSGQTPGVLGFGNPDNAELLDEEANFEWLYGLNGAIKGAVPRFLGFEDSYDSQYYYYLYDTTYPWNGPIFGIQYQLNDVPCCPNTTCNDEYSERPRPCCVPNDHFYSHFYEIREDSWETTKSRISINDISTNGVKEAFLPIATDDRRLLFRYTSTTGSFKRGEVLNGWIITSVVYFGDEMRAGIIELSAGTVGNTFTYNGTITSADGATAIVLAGYGIPNKAAFAGVYEFPKRISYYQVEINPKALIPTRTLDAAEAEAVVDNNGSITEVLMIAGGKGYKNPTVEAINPRVLDAFSPGDKSRFMQDGVVRAPENEIQNSFLTPDTSNQIDDNVRDTFTDYGVDIGQIPFASDKNAEKVKLKKAILEVSEITEDGEIMSIRVVDGGAGYNQSEPPTVMIVEPETFDYKSPEIAEGNEEQVRKTITQMGTDFAYKFKDAMPASEFNQFNNYMTSSFVTATAGPKTAVVDTYLRVPDREDGHETKYCFDIPAKCISIPVSGTLSSVPANWESLFTYTTADPGVAEWYKDSSGLISDAFRKGDAYIDNMSSAYGAFGGSNCITSAQPKLYNIRRWFDMPCAFLAAGGDEAGEQKAYGYLVYKYNASEEQEASFRVSLEIEGKTIGSMGSDFMDFLNGMQKPRLTPTRKVSGGYKTWSCRQSGVDGRCYRDPTNPSDIIFVPVGLDENTFDYNRQGFSEYEQFRLWLGDNLTGGGLTSGSTSWSWVDDETTSSTDPNTGETTSTTTSYGGTTSTSYTAFTVDCSPDPGSTNVPNHDCWDKYVRASGAPSDAPLNVYCGYDVNGNGIGGQRFWEIRGPANGTVPDGYTTPTGPVNPFCSQCTGSSTYPIWSIVFGGGPPACGLDNVNDASIAVDPQRIYDHGDGVGKVMQMGSYDGTMLVRNWLTGGSIQLGRTIRNMGNPYFDECDGLNSWRAGNSINDDII